MQPIPLLHSNDIITQHNANHQIHQVLQNNLYSMYHSEEA